MPQANVRLDSTGRFHFRTRRESRSALQVSAGGYQAISDDGTTVRVSRSYAPDIRDRLV